MTNENVDVLFGAIAEILKQKNDEISLMKWQIASLEEKLKKYEGETK